MFWEGFLRSLSSDIFVGVGSLFVVAILYLIVSIIVRKSANSSEESRDTMVVARVIAVVLVVSVVLILFGRAASVAFANRVPRQDIDKSPVYEQMDSHGQKSR